MTLPTSPPITMQQIATEFGQALTVPLESYYASPGGSIVGAGTTNVTSVAVPTSGAISFYNFLGVSAFSNITHIFGVTGANTETIPSGAGNVTIEVWGPGGGGTSGHQTSGCLSTCGAGGGSGAYTRSAVISVAGHAGGTITLFVGTGGTGGAANAVMGVQAGNGQSNSNVRTGTFSITTMNAGPGFGAKGPNPGAGGNIHTGGLVNTNGNTGICISGGLAVPGVHNPPGNGAGGAGRAGHITAGSPGANGGVVFFYTV